MQFLEANLHRPVIQPRLAGDAPPQINRLEGEATLAALALQLGPDALSEGIPLSHQIGERGTNEHPNDREVTNGWGCLIAHAMWRLR